MAWTDDMTELLRNLVNDLDGTTYTDAALQRTLAVAAFQVLQESMTFSQEFVVTVGTSPEISPDPTDDPRDDSFINLVSLKAACIVDRGAAVTAANRAIAVRDGSSSIDLRGVFAGKLALLQKGGWCAAYQDAKLEYQSGAVRIAGAAVLTPFRLHASDTGDDRYNRTFMF